MRSVLFVVAFVAAVAAAAAGPVLLSLLLRVGTPMKNPNLSAGDDTMKMGIVDDYLCAICDDGGSLVCCDGECGRLFHPNSFHGQASNCRSLELHDDQWRPKLSKFICKNCEYKSHQCFVCGKLGSSETTSGPSEVLKCQKKYCGRFYHPNCLLKYDPIKNHEDFECPLHECHSCKNKGGTIITKEHTQKEEETYFVQCRRCPVAYHRKCLPRDISNVADNEVPRTFKFKIKKEGTQEQEQWFFYCREHEMVRELNSATRDHLKFPEPSIPSQEHMVGEFNNATRGPSIPCLEHEKVGELNSATQDHLPQPSIPSLDDDMVGDLNSATQDHLPELSIPSLDDDMVGDLNSATQDHLPEASIPSLDDDMVGDLNNATQNHPQPSIPSLEHDMVGEPNNATQDHLNIPVKPVFNFDLNEKPPEETEAPEPDASTSSAPMESSEYRPSFPCQPPGYGG